MHQQATLVSANVKLGNAGALVSIDDIEKHYATTAAANAAAKYKCADPKCGVSVIAVITKLTKQTRKNSPTSYFRASRKNPHVKGCSRAPVPTKVTTTTHGGTAGQASPNRTSAPTVWVDPLATAGSGVGGGGNATGTPSTGSRGTRGANGSGMSQGHSQMVETFAKKWVGMNAQTQRTTSLAAPWNPHGTYHSAFHPFAYNKAVDASTVGIKIYVGVVKQLINSPSGYIITLQEKNSGGEALEVLVPPAVFQYGAPGRALNSKLARLIGSTNPVTVFALGIFSKNPTGAISLSVAHPHCMHVQ